jgi:Fur family zinc uptake transcriptional regulator
MASSTPASGSLTRNQRLVLEQLRAAGGPLSAYTILEQLRDQGFKAPLQVYRALDKLVEQALVHRLESLNAFVACNHPGCTSHETVAFAICDTCGNVEEIASQRLAQKLEALAAEAHFLPLKSTVELHGRCSDCQTG